MNISNKQQQLLDLLNANSNSFEKYFDESADEPTVQSIPSMTQDNGRNTLGLGQSRYNPQSQAQFDVNISLSYWTAVVATGVWTAKTAAQALAAGLNGDLPAVVFGQSDFTAGYPYFQGANAINTWGYRNPFIYGSGSDSVNIAGTNVRVDSTVTATLSKGDMIIPFQVTTGGAEWVALITIHCTQVAYGTLLQSLSSDRFVINGLRYTIADTSLVAQFSNAITPARQNNFGVVKKDTVTPLSYKQPQNFQSGIIDIPLKYGVAKDAQLSTYLKYTIGSNITWTLFVLDIQRLPAR